MVETLTGVFVLAIILFVTCYLIRLGAESMWEDNYYHVYAEFYSVSGLKSGASIEMAGVDVGSVDSINLDPKTMMARVNMQIKRGVTLRDDVVASVQMRGIEGDQIIILSPGKSTKTLAAGGVIAHTKPALNIEELVSEFIQGKV